MPSLVLTLVGVWLLILGIEYLLWMLFRHRIQGMLFPREADASRASFVTLPRMRLLAIVHSLALLAISAAFLWLVW